MQHQDPRLRALFAAPAAQVQQEQVPAGYGRWVNVEQHEGYSGVAFRRSPDARHHAMIPHASRVLLHRTAGDWAEVSHAGERGFIKTHNIRAPAPPAASPAPVRGPATPTTDVCTFTVNGTEYTIDPSKDDIDGMVTVHDWLLLNIPGSRMRRSCGKGYCGACTLMLSYTDPVTSATIHRSFNSCLRPILSCNGMALTTAAGVGSEASPHPVQSALAENSGTQCGMCSVAMVMTLYAHLMDNKGKTFSEHELEGLLDGTVCRCTGYRPICDTYKSFATAPSSSGSGAASDLRRAEVFHPAIQERSGPQRRIGDVPLPEPQLPSPPPALHATTGGVEWVEVRTEAELQAKLKELASRPSPPSDVFLAAGRTSQGIYAGRKPEVFINIGGVPTLRQTTLSGGNVMLGAAATMSDTIVFLQAEAKLRGPTAGSVLAEIARHGLMAPGTSIRNTGTIGGNVMLAHKYQEAPFPTEWPLLLHAAGATVDVVDGLTGKTTSYSFEDFYKVDMAYKYLKGFTVPIGSGEVFRTYKTATRIKYAQAFVAAAMSSRVGSDGKVVAGSARIVFSGLGKVASRVTAVEAAMEGQLPSDEANFQQKVLPALESAITTSGTICSSDYSKSLARSFVYKYFLALQQNTLPADLQSGAQPWIDRDVTKSTQAFVADPAAFPVGQAMPKVDGLKQCTGEAQYVPDVPIPAGCLHAAPVSAKQLGTIASISSSSAEAQPGFVIFLSAEQVPKGMGTGYLEPAWVKAGDKTTHVGQMIGLVLAQTPAQAVACAQMIHVTYTGVTEPCITIDDAIAAGRVVPWGGGGVTKGDADGAFASAAVVIEDTFYLNKQYHYHLEKQSVLALPGQDGGVIVHSATQMPVPTAQLVAGALGVPISKIDVRNRRCGGGFGGKLGNSMPPAIAASMASVLTQKPVRLVYELGDNMAMTGLRPDWKLYTKVGCAQDGTISAVKLVATCNAGWSTGEVGFSQSAYLAAFDNSYDIANWDVTAQACVTDLPWNTSMRAPGWLPAIYHCERMISCVAAKTGVDAQTVRQKNFYKKGGVTPYGMKLNDWKMPEIWAKAKESAAYDARVAEVAAFNKANRWVKKGLSMVPSKFGVGYSDDVKGADTMFDVQVKVAKDGSVAVMSGGTEMGQGLTTKVAQTIGYNLGVDLSLVTFVEQTTSVLQGGDATGGSVGSELTCRAAKNCCDELVGKLAPVRRSLPGGTWQQIVAKAYDLGIMLTSHQFSTGTLPPVDPKAQNPHEYNTCGVAFVEATLDVLTGQVDLSRADVVYDLGKSVNPDVDIGQVEGAFVMGCGMAVTEDVRYFPTGQMRWYEYMLPTPWEMPGEFNVTLLKSTTNPYTVGGGRACGEPPMTTSYALVEAIAQAAKAAGAPALPARLPLGPEACHGLCAVDAASLVFH